MTQYNAGWITDLPLLHQGKVRDIFAVDDEHLLIVASDRLSAFDVILPDPIPGKGEWLTQISNFWFAMTRKVQPNHLTGIDIREVISDGGLAKLLRPRCAVVKKLKPVPIEAIVRGYLIGSGWDDYQASGRLCGIDLPDNLQQAQQLPETMFTPSTKATTGQHDENISLDQVRDMLGGELANQVQQASLSIYRLAADYARGRGIIIADTKFEFGLDEQGRLLVMDEMLTPDSSRFWPEDEYRVGISPPSYDKQYVRDYLETLDWDKTPPGPRLPEEIIQATADRYTEACERLMG